MGRLLHSETIGQIIKAFYKVYNTLGYGFLEKVYKNALMSEIIDLGFDVKAQVPIKVFYNGKEVGEYFADIVVQEKTILEIKTASSIDKSHEAQLLIT